MRAEDREAHRLIDALTVSMLLLLLYALTGCTTRLEFGNEGSSGYVFKAGSGPAPCKEEGP